MSSITFGGTKIQSGTLFSSSKYITLKCNYNKEIKYIRLCNKVTEEVVVSLWKFSDYFSYRFSTLFQWWLLLFPRIKIKTNTSHEIRLIYPSFHAFLFNFRNYSLEVSNIKRREAERNINLLMVNNLDIK